MGALLSYSIISGLAMLAMYLAYRVLLARDNQHAFNRGVLLMIYAVSFVAVPVIPALGNPFDVSSPAVSLEGVGAVSGAVVPAGHPLWSTVLLWIFMAGMAVVAVRTIIIWLRLVRVIRSGRKIRRDGYTLVVTSDRRFAPFSWMNYMVISREDYETGFVAITTHELKHVTSRHWIDLLIAQAVCIVNWFNPAAWLMRDELMLVHEYQADMAVIDSGLDTQEYQMLLIKKAVGARFPSLANSLNHSKLKKRITMMYQEKSGAGRRFKALALVPMLALALGAASVPAVRAAVSTISDSSVSVSKSSENLSESKASVKFYRVNNINSDGNETAVVVHGEGLGNSLSVSGGTFTNNGKTYKAKSLKCEMADGVATITAVFPFSGDFKKPAMTLTVNGLDVPFNLEEFFNSSRSVQVKASAGSSTISTVTISDKPTTTSDEVEFYFDGKKISEEELRQLSPDKIASMTIDKASKPTKILINSK